MYEQVNVTPMLNLGGSRPWVALGQLSRPLKHLQVLPQSFSVAGLPDGTSLDASLIFAGTIGGMNIRTDNVTIGATVFGTPSLTKSVFKIPNEITHGQKVTMSIEAKGTWRSLLTTVQYDCDVFVHR